MSLYRATLLPLAVHFETVSHGQHPTEPCIWKPTIAHIGTNALYTCIWRYV